MNKYGRYKNYDSWKRKQFYWKKNRGFSECVEFRGNESWCLMFGDDRNKPRFIGDRKDTITRLYPARIVRSEK